MPLNIISGVQLIQKVTASALDEIPDERAASEDGLAENHNYVDLRGMTIEDLTEALEFEADAFLALEEDGYSERLIEEIDDQWLEVCLPVDFGVGSTVAALSAIGCTPITSCRGESLGGFHGHSAPTVSFYSDTGLVPMLLEAAKAAGISIENNTGMIEVYCDDLRKMHKFASLLGRQVVGSGP